MAGAADGAAASPRSDPPADNPASAASDTPLATDPDDPIVQYIVLRRDLWRGQGWPLGPIVAQGAHAAVAAVWENRGDPEVLAYVADGALDGMHKARRCTAVTERAQAVTHCKMNTYSLSAAVAYCCALSASLHACNGKTQAGSKAAVLVAFWNTDVRWLQVVFEAKSAEQLENLQSKLKSDGIACKLWVEQPENVPTALATKPCRKSLVTQYVKKFNLCKAAVSLWRDSRRSALCTACTVWLLISLTHCQACILCILLLGHQTRACAARCSSATHHCILFCHAGLLQQSLLFALCVRRQLHALCGMNLS